MANEYSDAESRLLDKARNILPVVDQYRAWGTEHRDTAPQIIEQLNEAGLFRLFQPKSYGGEELDPRAFWAIQNVFAERCLSTAWIHGVLCVQAFVLALFDRQAQDEVWGESASTLVSSSFQPVGKVEVKDGGYRLSGHWTFSSGSSYAKWAIVGGMVYPNGNDQPPQMGLFLLPRDDYQIVDTWHTFGLRATGSNDIIADDVWVPAHRMYLPSAGMVPDLSRAGELPALYQLPWLYIFSSGISNLGIGGCRAALNDFVDIAKARKSIVTGKATKEDPDALKLIAKARTALVNAHMMYNRHVDEMLDFIDRGEDMPLDYGLLLRSQMTGLMRELTQYVDQMRLLLGGRGVREDSPITQHWLDMSAACAHPGNDSRGIEALYGKMQL